MSRDRASIPARLGACPRKPDRRPALVRWAIGLLLALLVTGSAAASPLIVNARSASSTGQSLEPHMQYLIDRGGDLDLAGAIAASAHGRFQPVPTARGTNFGFADHPVWLRFTLDAEPDAGGHYVIEIPYAPLDRVNLYLPQTGQRFQAGDRVAFSERPIDYRVPAFPLTLAPGTPQTAYLKVETQGSLQVPALLWQAQAFDDQTRTESYALGSYFGICMAIGLYNLLLFLALRDRNYLYYIILVATYALFAFTLNGLTFEFLWPNATAWANVALPVSAALTAAAVIQFARSFLQVRHFVPRAVHLFHAFQAIALLLLAGSFVMPYRLTVTLLTLLVLFMSGGILIVAIQCRQRGGKQARYFLVAWTLLLIGTALFAMNSAGWIPSNVLTRNGVQIGSALEMILLSFALADHKLLLQQENEHIRREATQRLEARVDQRTSELQSAIDELNGANRRLAALTRLDALTGLGNRLGMQEAIEREWSRAQRTGEPLSLLLLDIDHFKTINDTHGHPFGDTVLCRIAQVLTEQLGRGTDVVARYGGEEFLVVLPDTPPINAHLMAEQLRTRIETDLIRIEGIDVSVTASCGVTTLEPGERSIDSLIARTDQALYEAKRAGRNQTRVS